MGRRATIVSATPGPVCAAHHRRRKELAAVAGIWPELGLPFWLATGDVLLIEHQWEPGGRSKFGGRSRAVRAVRVAGWGSVLDGEGAEPEATPCEGGAATGRRLACARGRRQQGLPDGTPAGRTLDGAGVVCGEYRLLPIGRSVVRRVDSRQA